MDSEPGKGTAFRIYLPRIRTKANEDLGKKAEKFHGQEELVLLVEDEMSLRSLFARMVKTLGYRIETAANGEEALMKVEKEHLKPDLLITDEAIVRHGIVSPDIFFLQKPFNVTDLSAKIHEVMA